MRFLKRRTGHDPLSLLIFGAITLVGCGQTTTEHAFQVYEENGITVAETTGGPRYQEELFQYEFLLELQEDEREESLLFRPSAFFMDEDGFFYVTDQGNGRVAVFTPEGHYSHTLGRPGEGPGEFRHIQIQSLRDRIVSLLDVRLRRVTRLTTDGRLLDTTLLPIETGSNILAFQEALEEGWILIRKETPFSDEYDEYERICISTWNQGRDLIWEKEFEWIRTRFRDEMELAGEVYPGTFWYEYGGSPLCEYHPEMGFIYSTGWDAQLDQYDLNGQLKRRIRVSAPPEPATDQDRESLMRYMDSIIEQESGVNREMWQAERDNLRLPEYKAFCSAIEIDDSGFIWLQGPVHHYTLEDESISILRYRVLNSEGRYLGDTVRPKGNAVEVSHGHLLVTCIEQGKTAYRLRVYRIVPAVAGLTYP